MSHPDTRCIVHPWLNDTISAEIDCNELVLSEYTANEPIHDVVGILTQQKGPAIRQNHSGKVLE
jgi:hypothetical protein